MLLIGCVISATVLPLWEISIPQRMLSLLLDNAPADAVLVRLMQIGIVSLLLSALSAWLEQRYEMRIGLARTGLFRIMLMRKLMSIRYSALESSEIRQMADSAWNVTWSNNHGVEGTLRHLSKAASALFTLCGLALTLGALHPLVPYYCWRFQRWISWHCAA